MYLAIDFGNTKTKYFLFSDEEIIGKGNFYNNLNIKEIEEVCEKNEIDAIIYANVSKYNYNDLKKISKAKLVFEVNENLKLPFKNRYKTRVTLGPDRIGLVCGAIKKYPDTNVLVIDLGSCITYDFITSNKIYKGGAITPGFNMRYKSLNEYTGKLPMIDFNVPKRYNGDSTFESIHSGIYYGILDEIRGRINYYEKKFDTIKVIITGGDSNKLSKRLKNRIFADSNFIGEGLFYLLEFNL